MALKSSTLDVAPEVEAPAEPVPELVSDVELETPAAETAEPEPVAEALDVEAEVPAPFADVVLNVAPEVEAPAEPVPELPVDVELEAPATETAEPEPVAKALNVEPEAPASLADVVLNVAQIGRAHV